MGSVVGRVACGTDVPKIPPTPDRIPPLPTAFALTSLLKLTNSCSAGVMTN